MVTHALPERAKEAPSVVYSVSYYDHDMKEDVNDYKTELSFDEALEAVAFCNSIGFKATIHSVPVAT